MLHSMRKARGKKAFMAVKIDLEKAYDKINWDFLETVLSEAKIPCKFIRLIMRCVTSTTFNILWNGEKTEGLFGRTPILIQSNPIQSKWMG